MENCSTLMKNVPSFPDAVTIFLAWAHSWFADVLYELLSFSSTCFARVAGRGAS